MPLAIPADIVWAVRESVGATEGQGKEVDAWRVHGQRLLQSARTLAAHGSVASVGSIRALVAPTFGGVPRPYKVPRTIRRIYERMLTDVPVLQVTTSGNGSQVWSLARKKGWEPPEASEEDKRWIIG